MTDTDKLIEVVSEAMKEKSKETLVVDDIARAAILATLEGIRNRYDGDEVHPWFREIAAEITEDWQAMIDTIKAEME